MGYQYRHSISRYQEIGKILIRHGFGYLAEELGLNKKSLFKKAFHDPEFIRLTLPERVRVLFEDLGPTFIKLGQVISTRPDLIPHEFAVELQKLQDNVEQFEIEEVREQFIKELGALPEEIFAVFDYNPIASASIGQVHKGQLKDGRIVAIKVQRPRLQKVIEQDLRILKRLSGVLDRRTALGKVCDVEEIVKVFARSIHRELDYTVEGLNTEAFNRIFCNHPSIIVPAVYWDLTTKEIITMDFVEGYRVEEALTKFITPANRDKYISNMFLAFFYPFFHEGIFHGDPHPGNILFAKDGRLVLIDFGNVGRLDPSFRHHMAQLLVALMEKDVQALMEVMQRTGTVTRSLNKQNFYEDAAELLEKTNGFTTGEIDFGHIVSGMIAISLNHGIKMQDNFFILGKAVTIIESIARVISPKANFLECVKPMAIDYLKRELTPRLALGKACKETFDFVEMVKSLPYDLSKTLKAAARGELKFIFYHRNLNWLYDMLDIASSRIAFSLIIAALIVGSALIIIMDRGPRLFGYPLVGITGFAFSGILGSWMALIMLRRLR